MSQDPKKVTMWASGGRVLVKYEGKGLEEGMYLAYWNNGKETCVFGVECLWVWEVGHKI